eukprot:2779659-Amphidinium_carterae.1
MRSRGQIKRPCLHGLSHGSSSLDVPDDHTMTFCFLVSPGSNGHGGPIYLPVCMNGVKMDQ